MIKAVVTSLHADHINSKFKIQDIFLTFPGQLNGKFKDISKTYGKKAITSKEIPGPKLTILKLTS